MKKTETDRQTEKDKVLNGTGASSVAVREKERERVRERKTEKRETERKTDR